MNSAAAVTLSASRTLMARGICSMDIGFVGVCDGAVRRENREPRVRGRTTRWRCVAKDQTVTSDRSDSAASAAEGTQVLQWYRKVPVESDLELKMGAMFEGQAPVVAREDCYNVLIRGSLTLTEERKLAWLLAETWETDSLHRESQLSDENGLLVEVGPRLNFQTAWASNAVSICRACGLHSVLRIERSRRYLVHGLKSASAEVHHDFAQLVHDRMTETPYETPLESFDSGLVPEQTTTVPVLAEGRSALDRINASDGLGFDEWDIGYYADLFTKLGRDPTNVELYDLAQSNSEHSRHWFFKGKLVIDGVEMEKHLFDIVRDTLRANPGNSVIAFADNSSTIRGYVTPRLQPTRPGQPSEYEVAERDLDVLFTAETHNFPSGVAPFPGAETGAGGRIRDTAATGTGSLTTAGTAGYSFGNLHIRGYELPWEDASFGYPENLASPLQIVLQASNGASDYGNKFGEPLINGFTRSYGMRMPSGERREYVKPIMFSGGMGQMEHQHATKGEGEVGMYVVKVGGPAYRIGLGGGAASSMVQGENRADLDFNAVQRGDAEMEQKAYRVLRHCVEMGDRNPIVAVHDQGAGGNCNVVKELIYPEGAVINVRDIAIGDLSLSALELWVAEYQEQFGLLLRAEAVEEFRKICLRERVPCTVLGQIDGSGKIVLYDSVEGSNIVDLDLETVLGDLPQKTFASERQPEPLEELKWADDLDISEALDRVLRLPTVGSKRFLTTKVDRSVTGLVAQQQCVGPLQLPLSDYAVTANSMLSLTGSATSIGEKPNLTVLSPEAMARMSVGEMVTNLAGVAVTSLQNIKCEANWMWAAKLPGEGAALYDAVVAMKDAMIELGIAVDGGKDSLSMAARCPTESGQETVKAPGTLVVTGYCTVDDVRQKVNPAIQQPGDSKIVLLDLSDGKRRLGGSAFAQVYNQVGNECPDVESLEALKCAFEAVQVLVQEGMLTACHDVSDGGILVSLLEMAFAGNCGVRMQIGEAHGGILESLFAEELGLLVEVGRCDVGSLLDYFDSYGVTCEVLADTLVEPKVVVEIGSETVLEEEMTSLRDTWEATSFELERLQANPECVRQEQAGLSKRSGMSFHVPFSPTPTTAEVMGAVSKHRVAVIREEGSNGDREMANAFHMAGFSVSDISMSDLAAGEATLDDFRGVAFVGGFSYADVLGSAKGWAGTIRYQPVLQEQFTAFFKREDTFSLGVCNGCQLLALLGAVPFGLDELPGSQQPRFVHNESERYESRFTTVKLGNSPSIMLQGMEGSRLGVWVAHGEGRAYFPDEAVLSRVRDLGLVALTYVDEDGESTETYPFNPNGSADGIAGLCSADGRHLAVMPHPERTVLKWQWGYMPQQMENDLDASPWMQMFQNARQWCDKPVERR